MYVASYLEQIADIEELNAQQYSLVRTLYTPDTRHVRVTKSCIISFTFLELKCYKNVNT